MPGTSLVQYDKPKTSNVDVSQYKGGQAEDDQIGVQEFIKGRVVVVNSASPDDIALYRGVVTVSKGGQAEDDQIGVQEFIKGRVVAVNSASPDNVALCSGVITDYDVMGNPQWNVVDTDDAREIMCMSLSGISTAGEAVIYVGETVQSSALERFYSIDDIIEIRDFLQENSSLEEVLKAIHAKIIDYFAGHIQRIRLECFNDPNEDYSGLTVWISTDLSINDELDIMDSFELEWWLDQDVIARKLVSITFE